MPSFSANFIKNYFLEKMLSTHLYFMKFDKDSTDFITAINTVKKVLIIAPRDRAEEVLARKFVPQIRQLFASAKVSTLDVFSLRKTDVDWLGVPNSFFLAKIKDENFDLLLDLNSHHDRLCCYLGASTRAPLRMHLTEGKFDKIYNFHIRAGEPVALEKRYKRLVKNLAKIRHVKLVTA